MSYRLSPIAGEWIDRNQLVTFSYEGSTYTGYAGDTITSALWAAGQRVLGRSFKYHRPRGVLSLANHDVNALMQDGQKLNIRADVTPITVGMSLSAVNTFGGAMGDRASIIDGFSAFLPVGFYYKAFHHRRLFPVWERLIRQITGLGKLDTATPRLRTPKQYDFCDVLVIGAGISGMSAALAAAEVGADVVIVDENAQAGGSGGYQRGGTAGTETQALIDSVKNHPQIRLYTQTQAAAYFADHWIPLVNPSCLSKMRAKAVIVASGAYEQPAVFRNNDLPGVMLASAAQRLIYRYAVKPMHRAVVLTANRDGYAAAIDLIDAGVEIKAIVDLRFRVDNDDLLNRIRAHGIPVYTGHCIYEAKPNPAHDGVNSAVICPLDANGQPQTEAQRTLACDGILMSVGWVPAANLLYQAGAKLQFEPDLQQFVPDRLPAGVFACGRVNGVFVQDHKLQDGQRAGRAAAAFLHLTDAADMRERTSDLCPDLAAPDSFRLLSSSPTHPWAIVPHPQGKNFVDFDEDLQLKDFENAIQEGFDNIELLKRYTTVGMGASQGKHSNMNALRILARALGKTPDQVGTTTARPFFHPVPMSHLAGRGFHPVRQTALHSRHAALKAQWMLAGQWRRPAYYQQAGKTQLDCIQAEVEAVRQRVGLIDVSTLGKLEIRGANAAAFLERVYTGRFSNQKVGTTRYAVMLDEAGIVIDDGVVARLDTEHFYFTTTTSNAATIYRELSRLNLQWQMQCGLVNLTGAHAALNLAGADAYRVLAQLTPCDLSAAAFPYLAVRQAEVAGIPAILMRVGFVGEWGYEIHVAAESAPALWDALMTVGAAYKIQPFGVEAQRLLRLEKGHLIVGQDTDGLTTPMVAGLDWAIKADKPFFIGQRSLQILRQHPLKQKLVGFMLAPDYRGKPPQECHLVIDQGEIAGRLTSVAFSPTLNRYIGLAYLKSELANINQSFTIRLSDRSLIMATVSSTPFYDPENLRQKAAVSLRQEVTA